MALFEETSLRKRVEDQLAGSRHVNMVSVSGEDGVKLHNGEVAAR